MIGMPKSMMQEEMQPLGPVVKRETQERMDQANREGAALSITSNPGGAAQSWVRSHFERGEHLPTGEVVTVAGVCGCKDGVYTVSMTVPAATEAGYGAAKGPWVPLEADGAGRISVLADSEVLSGGALMAYAQEQADTIVALRAEVRGLQAENDRLRNTYGLDKRAPLKFHQGFDDGASPGHMSMGTALGGASGYAANTTGAKPGTNKTITRVPQEMELRVRDAFEPTRVSLAAMAMAWGPEWGNAQKLMQRLDAEFPKPDAERLAEVKGIAKAEGLHAFNVANVLRLPGIVCHTAGLPPDDQAALDRRAMLLHYSDGTREILSTVTPTAWANVVGIELVE